MKKPLPTLSAPTIVVELPVSKIKAKYRPFVIREQKALLLAQESKDPDTILETIKSVISSCSEGSVDIEKLTIADAAYFFVQLRIASVGPEVKFGMECESCGESNTMGFSLADVTVDTSNVKTTVDLGGGIGIVFRLPTLGDAFDVADTDEKSKKMLYALIQTVYDADQVYQKEDYTEEEFSNWIDGMNESQLTSIKEFIDNMPELRHTLTFNCIHCDHKQSRTLEGLHSFFRFGPDTRES